MTTPPAVRVAQDWLYLVIVIALSLYLVIGVIAWTWMIFSGVEVPDAFATVLATIVGALVGVLAPSQRTGKGETTS